MCIVFDNTLTVLHTTNIWPLFINNLKRSLWSDLYSFTLGLNSLLFRGRQLQDAKIFQNVWQNFASNQNHLCGIDLRRAFEIKFICLEVLFRQNCFKRIRLDIFRCRPLVYVFISAKCIFLLPFEEKRLIFNCCMAVLFEMTSSNRDGKLTKSHHVFLQKRIKYSTSSTKGKGKNIAKK